MNCFYFVIILFLFLKEIKSEEICSKINWWDLGNVDMFPNEICLVWDKEYEEKREFYSHICKINSTEYKEYIIDFLNVEGEDEYKFIFLHFLNQYEDTGQINCYNRTKHEIYKKVLNEKINQILPRKNDNVFNILKGINLILEIPNIFYRMFKSVIISGIAYVSYKKY